MILVFNKTDVKDAGFARDWMTDFERFQAALHDEEQKGAFGGEGHGGGSGYMSSLLNSMSLMLEEFYSHLSMVEVSSTTGDGVAGFFEAVEAKKQEFNKEYKPELEKRRKEREAEKLSEKERDLTSAMKGYNISTKGKRPGVPGSDNGADEDDEDKYDPEQYPDADEDEDDEDHALNTRFKAALAGTANWGETGLDGAAQYMKSGSR